MICQITGVEMNDEAEVWRKKFYNLENHVMISVPKKAHDKMVLEHMQMKDLIEDIYEIRSAIHNGHHDLIERMAEVLKK